MIEEQARVVAVRAGTATLAIERQSACGSCKASGGCGTAILANWFPQRQFTIQLNAPFGVVPGDLVVVGLNDGLLQTYALKLYALPLIALLGGAVVGQLFGRQLGLSAELASIVLGLLGLAGSLFYLRRASHGTANQKHSEIQLLRVVKQGLSGQDSVSVPIEGLTKRQNYE
jgi:sigma-E factor negative regulatory protein RseC